jgi:hypothetical protein
VANLLPVRLHARRIPLKTMSIASPRLSSVLALVFFCTTLAFTLL